MTTSSDKPLTLIDVVSDALSTIGIRGEFTQVPPASKLASPTSKNPLARAHFALIKELARMHVPSISISPLPEEYEAVADYIMRVCSLFDVTWLQEVGSEVASNSPVRVDEKMFCGQFVGAIDGNATHEVDCVIEALREEQDEDAYADYRYDELRVD